MFKAEFDFHVDASYLNFQFTGAVYIRVTYGINVTGDYLHPHIINYSIHPIVAENINNWPKLKREMEEAARVHAADTDIKIKAA
jgi:hypothetical protein